MILLAGYFPDIEFTGIELTRRGTRQRSGSSAWKSCRGALQDFAPLRLKDSSAFLRIRFVQGNAAEPAFDNSVFDLVYSVLALEQIEQIRHRALAEFARAAGKQALMIEPFRDVNNKWWQRANVIRRDYFRNRISNLPRYGLRPVLLTDDFPQEVFFKVCAVLTEKHLQ